MSYPPSPYVQQQLSFTLPALGAGILAGTTLGNAANPFYSNISKIIGFVLTTRGANGVSSTSLRIVPLGNISTEGECQVDVAGTINTDVSIYTVYWVNNYVKGLLPC